MYVIPDVDIMSTSIPLWPHLDTAFLYLDTSPLGFLPQVSRKPTHQTLREGQRQTQNVKRKA